MPKPDELHLPLDPEIESTLEAVREHEGFESIDQAAEWLLRRRLRKGTAGLTGRGRALYPVSRQGDRHQ